METNQGSVRAVDVLAVIDRCYQRAHFYRREDADEFRAARAAVADLANGLCVAVARLAEVDPSYHLLPNMVTALVAAKVTPPDAALAACGRAS